LYVQKDLRLKSKKADQTIESGPNAHTPANKRYERVYTRALSMGTSAPHEGSHANHLHTFYNAK